jgi:hypothetical protein
MRVHAAGRAAVASALLAVALPGIAAAQTVPPLPPIAPRLPPIGLPLPTFGLPPAVDPRSLQPATVPPRAGRMAPPYGRNRFAAPRKPPHGFAGTNINLQPPVPWGYPLGGPAPAVDPPAAELRALTGTLVLDITPAGSPLYVDGYYVGTADQFGGGIELEQGPHRVDIRASGYEPLSFDVRIAARRVTTFRESLKPIAREMPKDTSAPPAASPAPPPPPATFYVIPGCYVGNVPPADAKLPPGCDPAKVETFKPS